MSPRTILPTYEALDSPPLPLPAVVPPQERTVHLSDQVYMTRIGSRMIFSEQDARPLDTTPAPTKLNGSGYLTSAIARFCGFGYSSSNTEALSLVLDHSMNHADLSAVIYLYGPHYGRDARHPEGDFLLDFHDILEGRALQPYWLDVRSAIGAVALDAYVDLGRDALDAEAHSDRNGPTPVASQLIAWSTDPSEMTGAERYLSSAPHRTEPDPVFSVATTNYTVDFDRLGNIRHDGAS